MSNDDMYKVVDGKPIPTKAGYMEWLLRYGNEQDIIEHRLYIAHIVNLYANQPTKEETK